MQTFRKLSRTHFKEGLHDELADVKNKQKLKKKLVSHLAYISTRLENALEKNNLVFEYILNAINKHLLKLNNKKGYVTKNTAK